MDIKPSLQIKRSHASNKTAGVYYGEYIRSEEGEPRAIEFFVSGGRVDFTKPEEKEDIKNNKWSKDGILRTKEPEDSEENT